jgi:hypothetical protein
MARGLPLPSAAPATGGAVRLDYHHDTPEPGHVETP